MNHILQLQEQIKRQPYPFPTMIINKKLISVEDMEDLSYEDFEFQNYQSHPNINMKMAI